MLASLAERREAMLGAAPEMQSRLLVMTHDLEGAGEESTDGTWRGERRPETARRRTRVRTPPVPEAPAPPSTQARSTPPEPPEPPRRSRRRARRPRTRRRMPRFRHRCPRTERRRRRRRRPRGAVRRARVAAVGRGGRRPARSELDRVRLRRATEPDPSRSRRSLATDPDRAVARAPWDDRRMSDDFDARLREIEARYERVSAEMAEPGRRADPERLRTLGRAFAELEEIVTPYRQYRDAMRQAADARELAAVEDDPEMVAFLDEEADDGPGTRRRAPGHARALLVPKDPNDGKDLIVEIRAGAGGQEAALWAGELFEMYRRFAERHRWKTEVLSASPSDLGGFKDVVLEVRGRDAYRPAEARVRASIACSACRSPSPRAASTPRPPRSPCCRRPRRSRSRSVPRTSRSTSTARAGPGGSR